MLRLASLTGLVALAGCHTSVSAPSEYESITYPCDDAAAVQSRITTCLASSTCGGFLGLVGRLDGNDIVIDSMLDTSVFDLVQATGSATTQLDVVSMQGTAPYFYFALALESLGGDEDQSSSDPQIYQTARNANLVNGQLEDDLVDLELSIASEGELVLYEPVTGTGEVVVEERSPGRLRGTLHGDFGSGDDSVRGCFFSRATTRRLVSSQ